MTETGGGGDASRLEGLWRAIDVAYTRAHEAHPGALACRAGCADCCRVPSLSIERIEADAVRSHLRSLDEAGRARIAGLVSRDDEGACRLLDDDASCSIWPGRPVACRMFGLPFRIVPDVSWPDGKRRLLLVEHGAMAVDARELSSCRKNFGGVAIDAIARDVFVDETAVKSLLRSAATTAPGDREVLLEVVLRELGLPVPAPTGEREP